MSIFTSPRNTSSGLTENITQGVEFTISKDCTVKSLSFWLQTSVANISTIRAGIYKKSDLTLVGEGFSGGHRIDPLLEKHTVDGLNIPLIANESYMMCFLVSHPDIQAMGMTTLPTNIIVDDVTLNVPFTWLRQSASASPSLQYPANTPVTNRSLAFEAEIDFYTPPNLKVNVVGAWKESEVKVNVGGAWKDVDTIHVNIGGVWKETI